MYPGLPKPYKMNIKDHFQKRRHWLMLVFYDQSLTAGVLRRCTETGRLTIDAIKTLSTSGLSSGRISHSGKVNKAVARLLRTVCKESGLKDKRVLVGLDTPGLILTKKNGSSDACRLVPCTDSVYKRMLHDIARDSFVENQTITDVIPVRICMDGRNVETPMGICGQAEMDSFVVSAANPDLSNIKECVKKAGYKPEAWFSGYINLCHAFKSSAEENRQVLLIDMKHNALDMVMFKGAQPYYLETVHAGIERAVMESLCGIFNIDPFRAYEYFAKYQQNIQDSETEIIPPGLLPTCTMGLKWWEFHDIVLGQVKQLAYAENSLNHMIRKLQGELYCPPRQLLVTGKGAEIPCISAAFEKWFHIRSTAQASLCPAAYRNIPATAYGMACAISNDANTALL